MSHYVVLLRGINVGGHRRVPMQALRALAAELGCRDAQTYVASGNLLCTSDEPAHRVEAAFERALEARFGFAVDVVARSAAQWADYLDSNPFTAEGEQTPNLVMLCIGKQPATSEDAATLQARAGDNERVVLRGDALWLYFGDGSGRSKMGVGPSSGVWTTRNLRTVRNLAAMLA